MSEFMIGRGNYCHRSETDLPIIVLLGRGLTWIKSDTSIDMIPTSGCSSPLISSCFYFNLAFDQGIKR